MPFISPQINPECQTYWPPPADAGWRNDHLPDVTLCARPSAKANTDKPTLCIAIELLLFIPTPFEAGSLPKGATFSTPEGTVHTCICGIGPDAMRRVFANAVRNRPVDALLLAGFAGALDPVLPHAGCYEASPISETDESFRRRLSRWPVQENGDSPLRGTPLPTAKFVSSTVVVASAAEKAQLFATTGAQLVDMEGETFADMAEQHGMPWRIIRSVSDDARQTLPVGALTAGFDAATSRNRPLRLAVRLASHPTEIAPFIRFVSGLGAARRTLTNAVLAACG